MTVDEIGDYLTTTFGTIYRNGVPTGETACIALIPYPGPASEHNFGSAALKRERPRLQVYVRGVPTDSLEPSQRAHALYLAIGAIPVPVAIGGVKYHEVHVSPPSPLKQDSNKCFAFAFAVSFYKDVSPS